MFVIKINVYMGNMSVLSTPLNHLLIMSASAFITRLNHAKKTGKLLFPGELMLNSEHFALPEFKQIAKLIKEIDLSYTKLISIENFPHMPNLRTFCANGTRISKFNNFLALKCNDSLKIELKNTPLSLQNNFKLSLLVLFDDKLVSINGKTISQKLRAQAKQYHPCCAQLINKGWQITSTPPDEDSVKNLCEEYGVKYEVEEPVEKKEDSFQQLASFQINDEDVSIRSKVSMMKIKTPSPQKIRKSPIKVEKNDEEVNLSPIKIRAPNLAKFIDEKLASDLSSLFHKYGVEISPSDYYELSLAVCKLCEDIQKYQEIQENK